MARSPLPFLLVTLFLDAVGIGIVYPVMPDLIGEVQGGGIGNAAIWGGVLAAVYALVQFLCAPAVGALSDRFGRRPVLLVALAVMALDYVLFALAQSIWLLLALRVVAGATAATASTCNAAAADVSTPEHRSRVFGLLGGAFLAGFVFGPVLGGLLGEIGPRAPFWAAAALALANLAFGWWAFPETVRTPRPFEPARANPFAAFRSAARLGGSAGATILALLLHDVGIAAYVATWSYWGAAAFGWSPWLIGISLAAFGIVAAAVQAWGLGVALRLLGERRTILAGLALDALFFVAFALLPPTAAGGLIALILCPFSALGEVTVPALQARLSRLAPADAQGEVMGVAASARAGASIFAPFLMAAAFAWGAGLLPPFFGAAYVLGAVVMAGAALTFARASRPVPQAT